MDALKLSEAELKYFGELYAAACDSDSRGKVSGVNVAELFRASQLPPDILQQIIELCGAKRLGHFGRSQFYVALKLIAAAQLGLPLKLELFNTGLDIALPKFARISESGASDNRCSQRCDSPSSNLHQQPHLHQCSSDGALVSAHDNHSLGQLPPPPTKNQLRSTTSNSQQQQQQQPQLCFTGSPPPPPPVATKPFPMAAAQAPDLIRALAPATAIMGDVSPPAPNPEKEWAAYVVGNTGIHNPNALDGFVWHQFEDEKQLLATEDETSEQHSSDESGAGCDRGDRLSGSKSARDEGNEDDSGSGFGDDEDIWAITDEQREYYIAQFRSLQPDLGGLISGAIAKEFFEKSKLPIQELSKIWQLSDVNKDGALSIEEFFTAMHLVVLRRNNVELPEVLPAVLVPQLGKQHVVNDETSLPCVINSNDIGQNGFVRAGVCGNVNGGSPQKSEPTSPHIRDWTHFNESPTSSTVSSPGVKPVNFDFKKSTVEQDPKILHPVPMRLSPESQIVSSDESDATLRGLSMPEFLPYEPLKEQHKTTTTAAVASTNSKWVGGNGIGLPLAISSTAAVPSLESKLGPPPQAAIQRPVVKKTSLPGPGALPPPPQIGLLVSPSSDDPPDGNFSFPNSSFSGLSSSVGGVMSASYHQGMTTVTTTALIPGPKKEPPPPPPPRPKRNHTRSSSLDLNRLVAGRNGHTFGPPYLLGAPPAVPPRMSPSTTTPKKLVAQKSESDVGTVNPSSVEAIFASFHEFPSEIVEDLTSKDVLHLKAGAFEVYRRPTTEDGSNSSTTSNVTEGVQSMKDDTVLPLVDFNSNEDVAKEQWISNQPSVQRDKRELLSSIRSHRDRNSVLTRLNSELNQELAEVMEERIALEIQMEHLKPYSN